MNARDLLLRLLTGGPFVRSAAPFLLLQVSGPDAGEFLHRLCSQDVLGLADGALRPAAFLDAKGKLLVTCLLARVGDAFWLEVPAEQTDRLAALLERYHFTERLTIGRQAAGDCVETVELASGNGQSGAHRVGERLQLAFARRGVQFVREHGPGVAAPAGAPLDDDRAECVRMLAGLLRVGVATEATTLALEAEVDDHLSTTKGCYTGQEIVARIHTYGHANRRACLLLLPPGPPIAGAQPLHEPDDQLAVGRVMHAVPLPDGSARLGVGYLPKDFQPLGSRVALADGGVVEVIGYER